MDQSSGDSRPMSRFGGSDLDIRGSASGTFDPSFTAKMSKMMQVPKKIQISGQRQGQEYEGSDNDEINVNWNFDTVKSSDDVKMQVPDRIIVTGQEKHVGDKAMPRELQLGTAALPSDSETIRIQTPPRSITLMNAPTTVESDAYISADETSIVENSQVRPDGDRVLDGGVDHMPNSGDDVEKSILLRRRFARGKREFKTVNENNAAKGADELDDRNDAHLLEQLGRINRRLLALEEEFAERKEKERYLLIAGLLYVAYRTVSSLFKSGLPQR